MSEIKVDQTIIGNERLEVELTTYKNGSCMFSIGVGTTGSLSLYLYLDKEETKTLFYVLKDLIL